MPRFAACSRLALLGLLLAGSGCAGRRLAAEAPPHGSLTKVVASAQGEVSQAKRQPATLVLFSDADAMAIDPWTGEQRWHRRLRIHGTPSAHGETVLVPVRGHELVAIDLRSGEIRWQIQLPGQAITGVAAGDPVSIVTVVTGQKRRRSLVVGLSTLEGRPRWVRHSHGLFGVPAVVGRTAFVPLDDDAVALGTLQGRDLARIDTAVELERVEVHEHNVVAAEPNSFVDLGNGGRTRYALRSAVEGVRDIDGIDPGLGHADGVMWRILDPETADGPREAVFLGRRAIVAVRLDPLGRPVAPRWVHLRVRELEMVGLHPTRDLVIVVNEDGSITHIERDSGQALRTIAGPMPVRGSLLLGDLQPSEPPHRRAAPENFTGRLLAILADPSPRMLPAQQLALELMWRSPDPEVRAIVRDYAGGFERAMDPEVAPILEARAQALTASAWGRADPVSLAALLERLEHARNAKVLTRAAREAVESGGPGVTDELVDRLSDPHVDGDTLAELAKALRDLDDSKTVPAIRSFVLRYHADPDIVGESSAIFFAVELLLRQAFPGVPHRVEEDASALAKQTLAELLRDRFTVPQLQEFLRSRIDNADALVHASMK